MSPTRLLGTGALIAAACLPSGCSAVLDFEECTTSSDCDAGLACSTEGFCVSAASAVAVDSITSDECDLLVWPQDADEAVVIGALLPTSGALAPLGLAAEQGVALAADELSDAALDGDGGRPVAVLYCDTRGQASRATAAATHLESVGVRAVIGPLDEGAAEAVAAVASQAGGGFTMVAPGAFAPSLRDAAENQRIWRTGATERHTAAALVAALSAPATYGLGAGERVALMYQNDVHGQALRDALLAADGGATTLSLVPFPAAGSASDADVAAQVAQAAELLVAAAPDLVVMLGGPTATELLWFVEGIYDSRGWDPPSWLLSDRMQVGALGDAPHVSDTFNVSDALGRIRVVGTANGSTEAAAEFENQYVAAYAGGASPPIAAHAYDAAFALALAVARARVPRLDQLTADDVADGLGQLDAGASVDVGRGDIQTAMSAMEGGAGSVDLTGAGSELTFDAKGDPLALTYALWRLSGDGDFSADPLGTVEPEAADPEADDAGEEGQ